MNAITANCRLHKLILMLSSDQDGEVLAAAAAITRTLEAEGSTWHDLAAVLTKTEVEQTTGIETMIDEAIDSGELTDWEAAFCASLRSQFRRRGKLSEKQSNVLTRIWERVTA